MIPILAVVGPTGSGKTALGIALAERLGTEIVSADSMQVYRGMEIGTGAPTAAEQARVKHHFISFLDPGSLFSAGDFQRLASDVVVQLNRQGKTAVVVGGSGLYLRALIDGLFDGPGRDETIRARLNDEAHTLGVHTLYEKLQAIDPDYAEQIRPNDLRRIVRALEVYEVSGQPLSVHHRDQQEERRGFDAVRVLIDWPRPLLYERINARVDEMMRSGFLDEVRRLHADGYAPHLERLRSLGYRDMLAHLRGEQNLDEAVAAMKQATRNFAKRQLTWFRADPRIHWLPMTPDRRVDDLAEEVLALFARAR